MIKKAIDYYYYRCYDFLNMFKSYDLPFAALHLMSMVAGLVSIKVLLLFKLVHKNDELGIRIFGFAAYLLPLLIFYLICFRKRKYRNIIAMFKNEGRIQQMLGRVVLVIAIIFFLFF